jgi:hypothetical protein
MPRLFIRHATRWIIISAICMYAMGGFPAIAAACEGGGEEYSIEATFTEESIASTLTVTNNDALEVEVLRLLGDPGTGAITSVGTCTAGKKLPNGASCKFTQDDPPGGNADVKKL